MPAGRWPEKDNGEIAGKMAVQMEIAHLPRENYIEMAGQTVHLPRVYDIDMIQ